LQDLRRFGDGGNARFESDDARGLRSTAKDTYEIQNPITTFD
jgi:hypothetical protein